MADRSPAAWLELLERRLHDRWNSIQTYDDYYEGDHYFGAWLRSLQVAFRGTLLGNLLNGLTDNYMQLVVDAAAERLRVQGIRFGTSDADQDVQRIWQANGCDASSNMIHTEAIKLGEAYWLVQPNGDVPRITAEHPSQVIVATAPGDRRVRLAALKKWCDEDGYAYANVYLPNYVVKYQSAEKARREIQWKQIETISNPLGEVPVIPMPNNPSMLRGGRSDLSFGATSVQDQITKTVADLLIGSEYHGLPQRVLLGVEPPRDESGNVIPFEQAAKSRLWYFNSANAKAFEFSQADLKGLRETADGFIGDLAAQTRVPVYYFRPTAISNLSAEALIGLDAGLVSKTDDKKVAFGDGHEDMARLALKAVNPSDPRASDVSAETIWANTESRSQAQLTDSVTKEVSIGLPFEAALERLGYSPQAIERILAMREADNLLNAPPPPIATQPQVTTVAAESPQPPSN